MRHLALAALLSLPPATPAAILAFTDNATAPAGTHQTLSLNLFDSALGTLNAVTLTLSASYQSQIIVANFDTSPIAAEGLLAMDFAYSSGLQGLDAFLATRSSLLLEDSTGIQSVPGATDNFPLRAMADRQADTLATGLNPAWFAQTGGGAFTIACVPLASAAVADDLGALGWADATTAECGAAIRYDYTARAASLPEPSSLGLAGAGLLGLAGHRAPSGKKAQRA